MDAHKDPDPDPDPKKIGPDPQHWSKLSKTSGCKLVVLCGYAKNAEGKGVERKFFATS